MMKANKPAYVYGFRLDTDGLSAQLNANGTVSLIDNESSIEKYRIPLPYMFDAKGTRSDDVFYSLTSAGKDCYLLTVTAESKWINSEERVFPITIDPTIKPIISCDTYINSSSPGTNYGSSEELWVSPSRISFIKANVSAIPSNIDIALFVACSTGVGGLRSLPAQIVEKGAKSAVGFKDKIGCDEANIWTEEVYKALLAGKTIGDAVNEACNKFPSNSTIHSAIVFGDDTVVLG